MGTMSFLGGGNMTAAIVAGLVADGLSPSDICVLDRHLEKREQLSRNYGVQTTDAYETALASAQVVVLAIKPQGFSELISEVQALLNQRECIIVSIMTGIRLETLQEAFPKQAIIRAMPNTPARVQSGMTLLVANKSTHPDQLNQVQQIFNAIGETFITPNERAFEQLTALTGCGPAFVFYLVDLFAKAMQEITPEIDCLPLSRATFEGALNLMQKEQTDPQTLITQVCSKGGMTIEAMKILNAAPLPALLVETLQAAIKRSDELADIQ
jgi:pyrroline-5-carboxylate reductase